MSVYFRLNDHFMSHKIAHRGLHSQTVAENSLKSFELAIERGYAIEIDTHLLTDGEVAVVHDSNLKRVTGKDVVVETLSSSDLARYPLWDGQVIPLLKDVLALIDGRVPLLIELKFNESFDAAQADAVLKLLEGYAYPEMIALQSFNPYAVKYVKEKTDDYSAGLLAMWNYEGLSPFKKYILSRLRMFKKCHADFVSYDVTALPNRYVEKWRKKGYQLLCWTINTPEKLARAKAVAADNIIFEKVDVEA